MSVKVFEEVLLTDMSLAIKVFKTVRGTDSELVGENVEKDQIGRIGAYPF